MRVTTNNAPRDVIYGHELAPQELAEFDYYSAEQLRTAEFFRYKGQLYDLGEFERTTVPGWDGQLVDTFFSAVLVRYTDDYQSVVVGLAFT